MTEHHGRVQESIMRDTEKQGSSRNGTSPIPRNEIAERISSRSEEYSGKSSTEIYRLKQKNLQLELQLLQHQEQQRHQQQQQRHQQQHHPPQPALHQIFSRHHHPHHHQMEQQHHASQHPLGMFEQQSQQQQISNFFPPWSPAPQLLQQARAQNRMHHAPYPGTFQQEGGGTGSHENGAKSDSPSDIANLQRLIQMHQMQQAQQIPSYGLGQSNHNSQLSSLMGNSRLLAQLESRSNDQHALINNHSLLQYTNNGGSDSSGGGIRGGGAEGNSLFHHSNGGGGNSAPTDGTHSPHQHSEVSNAYALLHSQHGFGGPSRQG